MTIALFSDSYFPTKSGVVTVVVQLREQLIKLGHKVLLITVETTEDYNSNDPLVYQVKSKPLGLGTDQFIGIPFLPHLVKFIKENNVDLIHCHTEFGIGASIANVVQAILGDEDRILPVSTLLQGQYGQQNVYASVPCRINNEGIAEIIELNLTDEENAKFVQSCRTMDANYRKALEF